MADTVARRLAFLEGIDLAPSEIEEIAGELGQFEQALAALEPFADESAWPVAQAQPYRATHAPPPQPPNSGGSPAAGLGEVDAGTGEVWRLGVAALGRRLRAREVSSLEVTDAVLARLEQLDGRLNAFITVIAEQAR